MKRALAYAQRAAITLTGLALIRRVVIDPDVTGIVQAVIDANNRIVKVAIGERIIELRDETRLPEFLAGIDDPIMTELFAGLTDADLVWIEAQLEEATC